METTLPVEIIELTIDNLQDDSESLKTLAITCRTLVHRTRMHLFRRIIIRSQIETDRLCALLHREPSLKRHIRHVTVRLDGVRPTVNGLIRPYSAGSLFDVVPLRLLPELPRVCNWSFIDSEPAIGVQEPWAECTPVEFRTLTVACFAQYAPVLELYLGPLQLSTCTMLARLVASCSSLRLLSCKQLVFRERGASYDHVKQRLLSHDGPLTLEVGPSLLMRFDMF